MSDTGNALCGSVCGLSVATVDHHTRTLGREEFCDSQADAVGAADHDRAAAGERSAGQLSSCANAMASMFQ